MIYADYNGSAPICGDVKDYLIERLQNGPFANPNAIHQLGAKTLMAMENARSIAAKAMGAKYSQLIFNSGSTEGISQVFYTLLEDAKERGKTAFISTGIEHSAIVNNGKHYADKHGLEMKILPTKPNGVVDMETLEIWLKEFGNKLAMVTVMAANNETGVIQPYKEIAALCQAAEVPFFCDTTQLIGKAPYSFADSGADYAVMSGHKMGALTGTGILLAKDPTTLKQIIIGGGQEKSLRGGTQHYLGFETLAVAFNYFEKNLSKMDALKEKRIEFEAKLKKDFPGIVIIGEDAPRLASSTYVAYPGIHGQAVQIELESQNIFVTTSSACSDNEPATSKVLKAIGVNDDIGRGVVRISLGLCSPLEWYNDIYVALSKAYNKLKQIKSY
jgi:cysteine desulfurase